MSEGITTLLQITSVCDVHRLEGLAHTHAQGGSISQEHGTYNCTMPATGAVLREEADLARDLTAKWSKRRQRSTEENHSQPLPALQMPTATHCSLRSSVVPPTRSVDLLTRRRIVE